MSEVHILGGRVLDPASGLDCTTDVRIAGGRIVAIGPSTPPASEDVVLDARGCVVAPGFVDLQCFLSGDDHDDAETLGTLGTAAAAGGFTTVCCVVDGERRLDHGAEARAFAERARREAAVRVLPLGAITRGRDGAELAELGELAESGAVAFGDGLAAVRSARLLRHALAYSALLERPIVEHPCDPELARGGLMHEGTIATRLGLPGIPAAAEEIAVARAIALARLTGGWLHLGTVSTAAAVDLLRAARAEGLRVTAAVSAHHLLLDHTAVAEGPAGAPYHAATKLDPPLRTTEDREALRAALADGTIAAVVSDHQPRRSIEKDCEFAYAAPGASALETTYGILMELVAAGVLSLGRAVEALTWGPAQVFGLDGGRLAVGGRADVVVFDPEPQWLVEPSRLRSRGKSTPLAGRWLRGRVRATLVNGGVVYRAES